MLDAWLPGLCACGRECGASASTRVRERGTRKRWSFWRKGAASRPSTSSLFSFHFHFHSSVLLGPVQAATYALNYGALAATLGAAWALGTPWPAAWAAGTAVRVAGTVLYVCLTGWTLGEDLWALLLSNVASLVDQVGSIAGASGAPSSAAISATLGGVLAVNAAAHVAMLSVVGAAAMKGVGLKPPRLPRRVAAAVWGRGMVEAGIGV